MQIVAVYLNDLGGLSLQFSDDAIYDGNYGANVVLRSRGRRFPLFGFGYSAVARVKDGEDIVWENIDVPNKRKMLQSNLQAS